MISLTLNLFFESYEKAYNVLNALKPEINSTPEHRSKTTISIKNNCFTIKIISKDLTALKASINSYLKSIILINNLLKEEF